MLWLLFGVASALFVYFALIKPFNFWKENGVPQYPFWITWREILLGFVQYRSLTEIIRKLYNDYPGDRYCGIYQFYTPLFVVRDPDLIKQITVKDFDHFVDHFQFVPENAEPLWEKNLFALKGDKWRDMRATLSPSFTGSKMKVMFGIISDCAKQFVLYFQEQKSEVITVEMKDVFTRFTNDVIASSAFGVSINSLRNRDNDFFLMGKEITNFQGLWKTLSFILMILAPTLSKYLGVTMFDKKVSRYFTELVKDNIRVREKEGIIRQDMIQLLTEERKQRLQNGVLTENDDSSVTKDGKRRKEQLTDEDIVAQALIFFFAGFDSVSTLMCFMAYELAINPEIQERLQSEIDDVLSNGTESLTYDVLSKMKYMDMVISESLRKWPAAVAMDRVCQKSYTVPPLKEEEAPVHLKKGDVIWIPVFGIHMDPELYPEPDRFDPERFSDENKSSINPYAYLPFGTGPRSCIGNRFALMETKLAFFQLLSNFTITVVEKTTIPLKLAKSPIQLTAEGGFWLGLKSRKSV